MRVEDREMNCLTGPDALGFINPLLANLCPVAQVGLLLTCTFTVPLCLTGTAEPPWAMIGPDLGGNHQKWDWIY